MLETLLAKTRTAIVERGPKSLRWARFFSPGSWIAILVVLIVGGRLFWVKAARPAHLHEITAAYGSVSLLYGEPQMNHDGSRFTYVALSDRGYALFLCDAATGHKQIVTEESGLGVLGNQLDIVAWPWSPDNGRFIYTTTSNLFVCPETGENSSTPPAIVANKVSNVAWLNPLEFTYVEKEIICHAKQQADGSWKIRKLPHQGQTLSLTAIDTHTIAWLQDGYICRYDLTKDFTETNNPFDTASWNAEVSPLTNDLVLWLDTSKLQQANGSPVLALEDLSPRKNSTIVNRNPPLFNAPDSPGALNGRGTIHFESGRVRGGATGLNTGKRLGIAGHQPRTIFAVMRRDAERSMLINIGSTITNGGFFGLGNQNDGLYLPIGDFRGKSAKTASLPAAWHILEVVYDGENCRSFVNGRRRDAVALPFNTVDREVEIGLRTDPYTRTNTAVSDGDFAELLIYNRALNYAEQRQVENYLNAKWFGIKSLSKQNPLVWLDPQVSGLVGFSYSKETGRFLITRSENWQTSLWLFNAGDGVSGHATEILQDKNIRNAQWIGSGEIAYISIRPDHSRLVLADLSGGRKDRLFAKDDVSCFKAMPDLKKLLFFGSVSNEPTPGIWQFDLDSSQLRELVSGSDHPSSYAIDIAPIRGSIKLPSGRSVNCYIYPPANFDRHKKYPLFLGNTMFRFTRNGEIGILWAPAMAACGAYVVIVDRSDWWPGIELWEENVVGVYQNLIQNPCIDARQVYLLGVSAETAYESQCLAKYPGLWRGAVFFTPSGLPDFSQSPAFQRRPKILLSVGSEQHDEERLKKFQADALKSGVMVEIIVHPGEKHTIVGKAAQFERTKAMMHLIFEE